MRSPTEEECEDESIHNIELMPEASSWNLPSPEFSRQEQSMFKYRGQFASPNIAAMRQLYIDSVTSYAYDAADVLDDDNYATVLLSFVNASSLQIAQVNTKKVSGLDHLVLVKKGVLHSST